MGTVTHLTTDMIVKHQLRKAGASAAVFPYEVAGLLVVQTFEEWMKYQQYFAQGVLFGLETQKALCTAFFPRR